MIDRCVLPPPTFAFPRPVRPPRVGRLVFFFYRHWPEWFMPRQICSYCPAVIAAGGLFSRGKVSHGVCKPCATEALEQARLERRQRAREQANHRTIMALMRCCFFAAALLSVGCGKSSSDQERPLVYRPQLHASVTVTPEQRPSVEVHP